MAEINLKVCDECRDVTSEAITYALSKDSVAAVEVDLCSKHAGPFEKLLDKYGEEHAAPPPKPRAAPRRRARKGGFQSLVTTVEDIESRKKNK